MSINTLFSGWSKHVLERKPIKTAPCCLSGVRLPLTRMVFRISTCTALLIQCALQTLCFAAHIHGCHISDASKGNEERSALRQQREGCQTVRRWQELPYQSLPAHSTWTTVRLVFKCASLLTVIHSHFLMLKLKGKFYSLGISPCMLVSSQSLPHSPKRQCSCSEAR